MKLPFSRKNYQLRNVHIAAGVVATIFVAGTFISLGRASGFFATVEPESGALSGNAQLVTDASASGGRAVQFTAPSGGGGGTGGGGGGASCLPGTHVPGGSDGAGGCWPGPNNTGVPAGTSLTAYTGPCTITANNTVIDSKIINCGLTIQAANVLIRNSKIYGGVGIDGDNASSRNWSFTLQDSEVDKGSEQLAAVSSANSTIIRSNIHGGETAVQCDEHSIYCKVQDSWLHGQYLPDDQPWHLGGFLSNGTPGKANCTVPTAYGNQCIYMVHNYVVCDHPVNRLEEGCSGDINLIPNFGTASGVLIEHNLLGPNTDSAYCTYGGEKSTTPYPHGNNIIYKDNIFARGTNNACAAYGPVTSFDINQPGNQWINNRWSDGGIVDPEN